MKRRNLSYRERCYKKYGNSHWAFFHSSSRQEFDLSYKVYRKKFNRFMPPDKDADILDVACGAGHFIYYLQKEGYTNTQGIDISEEQLEIAASMGVKNLEKADLFEYLPKHKEQYDMIVANDIIEHLKKDETLNLLDLIHSALKPGGRVFIETLNAGSLFGSSTLYIDYTHEQGFTPNSLCQVLRVCNFNDVAVYGDGPVAYNLGSMIRVCLWRLTKKLLKLYLTIERGTGRGMWKRNNIFEHRMLALGWKK
jgi:2-polyprenyl-3-methyl-5-hydroxy-6-metoxy-1,4-benzoquinol methylase